MPVISTGFCRTFATVFSVCVPVLCVLSSHVCFDILDHQCTTKKKIGKIFNVVVAILFSFFFIVLHYMITSVTHAHTPVYTILTQN